MMRILADSPFVRLSDRITNRGQTDGTKAIRKRDNALPGLRAWEGACIACGRGDIPLGACHFRERKRVATRFDSWNAAGQCAKENRFEGGNLQEFNLAIGKGTLQQLVQLSS